MANLRTRETQIADQIDPPKFITRHYATEFMNRTGVHLPFIDLPYPQYKYREDPEPGYRPAREPFVAPPDWHPDPSGAPNVFRYWDGYKWTDLTRQHP